MKAVICPVCKGEYSEGRTDKCCGGKGWVEVHEDNIEKEIIYVYPHYYPDWTYYPRPYDWTPWYPYYPTITWCDTTTSPDWGNIAIT